MNRCNICNRPDDPSVFSDLERFDQDFTRGVEYHDHHHEFLCVECRESIFETLSDYPNEDEEVFE